jgi:hypothetical protein
MEHSIGGSTWIALYFAERLRGISTGQLMRRLRCQDFRVARATRKLVWPMS